MASARANLQDTGESLSPLFFFPRDAILEVFVCRGAVATNHSSPLFVLIGPGSWAAAPCVAARRTASSSPRPPRGEEAPGEGTRRGAGDGVASGGGGGDGAMVPAGRLWA
ncbi:unnamed protein product [Lampetra planeri]